MIEPLTMIERPRAGGAPLLERLAAPVALVDIELDGPLPSFPAPDPPRRPGTVLALVRLHRHPLGQVILDIGADGLSALDVARLVRGALGDEITGHCQRDGWAGERPECLRLRAQVCAAAPPVSVIVATRNRPAPLARCLDSLLAVEYPCVEIIVVDNDPGSADAAALVRSVYADRGVRYLREDRRGLAAAHNLGLENATGEIVAFTDDDVVVDRDWVAAIAEGFAMADGVGAVTGLILPAELRTETQLLLERHGGYSKGFQTRVFDLGAHRPADPLFPLAAGQCGSGANMAFNRRFLQRLGGFDPAMGTGTRAKGGDDLGAFLRVLAAGSRLVYQPAAIVRHWHHDAPAALANQAYGYGVGLGAYLTDALARHPRIALGGAWRTPAAALASARVASARNRQRYAGWSPDAARLERRGLAVGPLAYAASRWAARGARRPR